MTSAFIIPDITMRNPGEATMQISAKATEVFHNIGPHKCDNCMICTRMLAREAADKSLKNKKVTIPKPVAISDRNLEADDTHHTVRPSQPPPIALATVMKELEDELAHMKLQLNELQALYNQHDPAISKRKRKIIYQSIQKILADVDAKTDQIYALYDVLEGQKQSGIEMTQQEVENTLQDLDINTESVRQRGGMGVEDDDLEVHSDEAESDQEEKILGPVRTHNDQSQHRGVSKPTPGQSWDITENSDLNGLLSWEGFDLKNELTGRSNVSTKRRN
jgi:molecular chaperone GrpE (heat shock protein)